jgi:hydrogenase maturation factor
MALNVPGDIVECGVFKGVGLMYWAKLLEIFAPGSHKHVVGFDVFGPFKQVPLQVAEEEIAVRHNQIAEGISKAEIAAIVETAGLAHRIELIEGDIAQTAPDYVAHHYGFRISLLHLDLDTYTGTKAALTAFWPVVSRGGVIVFDEYAVSGMGESQAVDEFFEGMEIRPLTVPYSNTPTAYLIKP